MDLVRKINIKATCLIGHVAFYCTPSMGVIFRVKVPNGGWRAPTVAKGKGVRREAESEGSRRQMHGPRYTNLIRGRISRMSHQYMTKSRAAKG